MKKFSFLLVLIVLFISGCAPKREHINLNDFICIDFAGYETKGHAIAYFDEEKFINQYGDKLVILEMDNRVLELRNQYGNNEMPANLLTKCIDFSLDKNDNLNTGDVIELKWHLDKEIIEKEFNCRLKYEKKQIQVSGLDELEEYDPFDDIELNYGGISPKGYISIKYNDSSLDGIKYSLVINGIDTNIDYYNSYSNKDSVSIRISCINNLDVTNYLKDKYGKTVIKKEKEYQIPKLPEYFSELKDVTFTQETLDEFWWTVYDYVNSEEYWCYGWNDPTPIIPNDIWEYIGVGLEPEIGLEIFDNYPEESSYRNQEYYNRIWLIYRVGAHAEYKDVKNRECVVDNEGTVIICLNDVCVMQDGSINYTNIDFPVTIQSANLKHFFYPEHSLDLLLWDYSKFASMGYIDAPRITHVFDYYKLQDVFEFFLDRNIENNIVLQK